LARGLDAKSIAADPTISSIVVAALKAFVKDIETDSTVE
jgi:hypothetical protein